MEKEDELEILKKKVYDLEKEVERFGSKLEKKAERQARLEKMKFKSENRGKMRLLVILIIIILVVDIISVIAYYKPDFSGIFKPGTKSNSTTNNTPTGGNLKKCSDGTLNDRCSIDKPKYCYNGNLVDKASICGCPSGRTKDFQSCV
jgi:hypothetical protein